MGRMVKQNIHRRLLHNLAGVHDDDAAAHLGNDAQVVGNQQDAHAFLLLDLLHQVQNLRLDGDVQRSGRFVRNQQFRVTAHRHGDHDTLAHTAGELVRIVFQHALRVRDADLLQDLGRALPRLLLG